MNPASTTLGELFLKRQTQLQESLYDEGWNDCKERVLEILNQPIQNCDLSWEETDSRMIEKIKKL